MTLDKRITEFVQNHHGDWQIVAGVAQLSLPSSVLYVSVHNGQLTFGVNCIGGPSLTVRQDQLLERLARWEGRWISERREALNDFPPWLVEPVRVELRRRANELFTLAGGHTDTTTSPEISPDSQAIEQARAVLKAASAPASLPIWHIRIAILTDAHGVYVVISHDDQPLFTSRHVAIDRLIEALEDAAQFAEYGMPYDDGGSALMSVRDWMARLSVVPDLRRILGVTV